MGMKRRLNIREVENGYVIETSVEREGNEPGSTSLARIGRQELVVDNLARLIKVVKAFFEPDIKE